MKLYFMPFACSLAARIALEEADLDAEFIQVSPSRTLPDGRDFHEISPMGYVPALETPAGFTLTECPAVLSYIADLAPEGVLAPPAYSDGRYRMMAWLNFMSTELHKAIFLPLMRSSSCAAEREAALARIGRPFGVLAGHLETHPFLEGGFSIADAYLLAVLNWCEHAGVPIADWPALAAWRETMRARPSVARAMATEWPLLKAA